MTIADVLSTPEGHKAFAVSTAIWLSTPLRRNLEPGFLVKIIKDDPQRFAESTKAWLETPLRRTLT